MSIYGNLKSVNEGLFLSKEGKEFINELKKEIKELDFKGNFKDKLKAGFTQKYDQERFNKVQQLIKKKFKKVHITDIVQVTSTSSNGVTSTSYMQYVCGLTSSNKAIGFEIEHAATWARIGYAVDNDLDSNVPIDIFEKAIDIASKYIDILMKKNIVNFRAKVDGEAKTAKDDANKLLSYINSKYGDKFETKLNKFTNTIKIKEK